ncbi:MAG TPA: SPOR domain-containing protein [Gemmatimonadales bacterium]|nr:SPOR domain-containing protein [Gemmatimonadales bacterium]
MSGKAGKGRRNGTVVRLAAIVSALSAVSAASAFSQTDPRLVEVIRHAQEGQSDSARLKVQRLLSATAPTDSLYPQIVYTQAMVASDAADMRRQLQRVAVEYSSSGWADDALLRLVQLDYASGNLEGAARNLERIRLDYPGSSLLPQASYWAARTYFDQKKPELACRWIAEGIGGSRGNIELQNQLGYLNQRCSQVAVAVPALKDTLTPARAPADTPQTVGALPADTARAAAPRRDTATTITLVPEPPAPAPPPRADTARAQPAPPQATPVPAPAPAASAGSRYRVQITAVRSVSTARSVAARLKSRGFEVVTVEEGGLYKVRVGDYPTKADAVAAVPEIKAKLGGSPFVVAES